MTRRCLTFVCHLCHRFAKEQRYGPARTAALFNITQRTLQACIGVCLCMTGWSPFHVESAAASSRQMAGFCVPDSAMLCWLTRSHVSTSTLLCRCGIFAGCTSNSDGRPCSSVSSKGGA